ncbi:hypothetical protein QCA50_003754 [Cerrena zonata]|uniref:Uncharacterized protein n=1 Tax=Cerrena zonata TaxID=2478898 RepID=A0AAW0GM18_9APHY
MQRAQTEPFAGLCDIIASRPAVFESPCATSRNILCPPNSAFLIPDIPTFSETIGTSSEEPYPFRVPQNWYYGHVPEHYDLNGGQWRYCLFQQKRRPRIHLDQKLSLQRSLTDPLCCQ